MKPTTRLINGIEGIVEHFASISRGSNIHIRGGIGVNESVAVPKGCFPIKVDPSLYSWGRYNLIKQDGTIDVLVYQVAQKRPILSYDISEIVPNSVVRKVKDNELATGVGVTATENEWKYSIISNARGYHEKNSLIKRWDYDKAYGSKESVYQYLWRNKDNIPYLLVSPDVKVELAVEQFLTKYHEANKEKIETTHQ